GSKVVDQPEINTASSTDVPGEQKAPAADLRGGGAAGNKRPKGMQQDDPSISPRTGEAQTDEDNGVLSAVVCYPEITNVHLLKPQRVNFESEAEPGPIQTCSAKTYLARVERSGDWIAKATLKSRYVSEDRLNSISWGVPLPLDEYLTFSKNPSGESGREIKVIRVYAGRGDKNFAGFVSRGGEKVWETGRDRNAINVIPLKGGESIHVHDVSDRQRTITVDVSGKHRVSSLKHFFENKSQGGLVLKEDNVRRNT
ncbi:hypothetical protein, partial [Pandoraea commovens]|uniref:hypothetical protein n=1 Tax=Pandoraea commovens TaxID=2508289 RepID=UPI001584416A